MLVFIFISSSLLGQTQLKVSIVPDKVWINSPNALWALINPGATSSQATNPPCNMPIYMNNFGDNLFTFEPGFSGRIYFIIDTLGYLDSNKFKASITKPNYDTSFPYRYDFVELTYSNGPYDCADISCIDQLGLGLSIATFNSNGKDQSRGYRVPFDTLKNRLENIANPPKANRYPQNGNYIRINTQQHTPLYYTNMANYVNIIKKDTIKLFDVYSGSTASYVKYTNNNPSIDTVSYSGKFFYYYSYFNPTDSTFRLNPDPSVANDPSFLQGNITIKMHDLYSMIYACDGPFVVSGGDANKIPVDTDRVGYNDPWSTVVRNYLVGFNLGYYHNSMANKKSGNNSWNWNGRYAFTQGSGYYNNYARVIQKYSNAYGFPFSDFIVNPLLPISNTTGSVDNLLRIRIHSDTSTDYSDYTSLAHDTTGAVIPPTNYNDTSCSNKGINAVFNFQYILGNDTIAYNDSMSFFNKTFKIGFDYTMYNPPNNNPTPLLGNITFTIFPLYTNSLNKLPFSMANSNYNLYIRTDANCNFTQSFTDNNSIVTAINPEQTAVTLSNMVFCINPNSIISTDKGSTKYNSKIKQKKKSK